MKLSDLEKGTRAIKRVQLPLVNTRGPAILLDLDAQAASPEGPPPEAPGPTVDVGLIVLTGAETADVFQRAGQFARERGVEQWDEEHPLCTLGKMVHTLAIACIDPDSDPKNPKSFFDGGVDQILGSEHIGRDGIVYLYELQESWQDEVSPQILRLSPDEFLGKIVELARSEDSSPFVRLRPGTRWILARSMAVQLLTLLQLKSESGSPTESSTKSSQTKSANGSGIAGAAEP